MAPETKFNSVRPVPMVRFAGHLAWTWLVTAALCVPLQSATAQEQTQPPPVPQQNRAAIPQPNQSAPVTRAQISSPAQAASPAQTLNLTSSQPAAAPARSGQVAKSGARNKQKAADPAVGETPLPPPTLEQTPPSPPHVSYQNGQLSIDARNSTLSQVLRAVQAQTGAAVEIPGSASGERVVAQLGPGRPRDVLATLLNGSHFNYVILGMPGEGGGIQKVILTARQGGTATAPSSPVAGAATGQPVPPQDDDPQPDDDSSVAYQDNDVQQTGQAPPPGQMPGRPGFQGQPEQPQPPDGAEQEQNGVKTPEQLLQELQRIQQQQQQYQQQLNPANQQPAPQQ